MEEERGIHIHSRLLNKVARGVHLPVNNTGHIAIHHGGGKPFDDGSGPAEEGYDDELSQTSFSIPGESTRYKKEGVDEGLSEEAFPVREIKKPFEGPQISETFGAPPSQPVSKPADFKDTESSGQQKAPGILSPVSHEDTLAEDDKKPPEITEITAKQDTESSGEQKAPGILSPVSREDTLAEDDKKPPEITEITAKQEIIRNITGEKPLEVSEPSFDERDSQPFHENDFHPKKRVFEPSVLKPLFSTSEPVASQTEEPGTKDMPSIKKEIIVRGDKSKPDPQHTQKEKIRKEDYIKDSIRASTEQGKQDTIGHLIHADNIIRRPEFKKDIMDEKEKPVTKKVQAPRQGSIKIGRINITVRGKQKAEEDFWPEAPEYNDHIITDDWEWSCLYGRQGL